MRLQEARQLIEDQVPLLAGEPRHIWQRVRLHGCQMCSWHEGYECLDCRRVVDSELDRDLYAAIREVNHDQA